jgi:hypothetical protein
VPDIQRDSQAAVDSITESDYVHPASAVRSKQWDAVYLLKEKILKGMPAQTYKVKNKQTKKLRGP